MQPRGGDRLPDLRGRLAGSGEADPLGRDAGVELVPAHYRGSAPAIQDLLAGATNSRPWMSLMGREFQISGGESGHRPAQPSVHPGRL